MVFARIETSLNGASERKGSFFRRWVSGTDATAIKLRADANEPAWICIVGALTQAGDATTDKIRAIYMTNSGSVAFDVTLAMALQDVS